MQDAFEIRGYWFLPQQPENQIAGILTYIPQQKLCLELIGAFEEPMAFLKKMGKRKGKPNLIIHGIGQNAEEITLINCHSYGSVNFASPFAISSYTLDYLISGIHLNDIDEKAFNIGKIGITNLTEWINYYQVDFSISFKENTPTGFNLNYDIEKSRSFAANIDEQLVIEFEYGCSPPPAVHTENLIFEQNYILKLLTKDKINLKNMLELAYRFKSFLSLARQEEVVFNSIIFNSPEMHQQLTDGRKLFHPIKMFFIQDEVDATKKRTRDFIFHLSDIIPDFEMVLSKWYAFDHEMLPIIRHMIDSISKKKVFRSSDFLIVVQALEGFHTRFRIGTVNKPKIFLIDRLKSLHHEFSIIQTIKNIKFDFDYITTTRHYYSHFFSKKKNEKIAEGIALYEMTKSLKTLLMCCILRETGFSVEIIDKFIKKRRI